MKNDWIIFGIVVIFLLGIILNSTLLFIVGFFGQLWFYLYDMKHYEYQGLTEDSDSDCE